MELFEHWKEVKLLFRESFWSSFHYAIATVNKDGEPHVTPIGSLILGKPGHGLYFEEFPQKMPNNFKSNIHVCVLAVNSGRWFWIKSLIRGRFSSPPAVRLYGTVGNIRNATNSEIQSWQKRIKRLRFSKGHSMMWANMKMVRDIEFTRIEPVNMGEMTRNTWQRLKQI
jgi:hypothetical protein